jgi:hypothetical protein
MARRASRNSIRQTMAGLGQVIHGADPDDPGLFGYVEAYASLWLLELDDTLELDSHDPATEREMRSAPDNPAAKITHGPALELAL